MIRELELHPYQQTAVPLLREGFRCGHSAQILMAPTGFGKTVVATDMIGKAAARGTRCTFVVDRIALADQVSETLNEYGIHHGIIRASVRRDSDPLIQVCSAQTLEAQGSFPETDLLIVDECHDMRAFITEFIKSRPRMKTVGLSATPFTRGLGRVYTNLVNVCTTNELLQMQPERQLAPIKPYAAKPIDMSDMMSGSGEWQEKTVSDRGMKIVGDIVAEWRSKTVEHFGRPVKTIVFSASIAHGAELCRQFQEAGFNFQQISAKDTDEGRREALIKEFRKPNSAITGLVSCEVFTKGFDVPDILCGISARPYRKSLSKHIQQLGRVMRKYPGKEYALWLDHSGNYLRFLADMNDLFENGMRTLDEGTKRDTRVRHEPTETEKKNWTCSCGYIFQQPMSRCPACGKERSNPNRVITLPGVMEPVKGESAKTQKEIELARRPDVWRQLCHMATKRKPDDFEAARRFAQAMHKNLYGEFSRVPYRPVDDAPPSEWLQGQVKHFAIKNAHRRKSAA